MVRCSTSASSRGDGKRKAVSPSDIGPRVWDSEWENPGIKSQLCLPLSAYAPSLSSVEALPHEIVMRGHEIIQVKSTSVIANACSTLPGARSYSRAFHFILMQPEKEGVFFPHILYFLDWKTSMVHKIFYVVDFNFVRNDFGESGFGFLCSGLCSVSAVASWFILFQVQGWYFHIKSYFNSFSVNSFLDS